MAERLTAADIQAMVTHWLSTPPNGYLGSPYGADPRSMLQMPQSSTAADAFIDKMINDLPVLKQLPAGAINLYFEDVGNDKKRLLIEVLDSLIPIDLGES